MLTGDLSSQNDSQSPYVSALFNNIFSKNIIANLDTKPYKNIYTIHDNAMFVIHQQGFSKGNAEISKINIFSAIEETYYIPPSPTYIENGGKQSRIWIWTMALSDSLMFLAVDEGIWVYHYTVTKEYKYETTISIKDVSAMEIVNHNLHIFVTNDEGFDWIKINLKNNETKNVRKLVLSHHFSLQIAPLKIISINNNALYLLQRTEPIIEKYSLNGDLLATYRLQIPNWHPIPDNITRQLDSIDDITERNYAFARFSIFDYNMMHLFYAFPCERFFMIVIDRNKVTDTYITPYFVQIIGDSTVVEPYSVKLNENEKFGNKCFPFLTAFAEGNVVFAQVNEYVAQINNSADVSWQNKTQQEFQQEVNWFYRDNNPIEKIETFHLIKNYIAVDSVQFLDYDDKIFLLNDIKKDKAIFIISQYPQCATCTKVIWNYFSTKTTPNIELYNVISDCKTYLTKKENIKEVNLFLKTQYTPLFIDTKKLTSATKHILSQKSNPIILLFDKKLQHIEVISAVNIIGDLTGNLIPSFLHTIDNFAGD